MLNTIGQKCHRALKVTVRHGGGTDIKGFGTHPVLIIGKKCELLMNRRLAHHLSEIISCRYRETGAFSQAVDIFEPLRLNRKRGFLIIRKLYIAVKGPLTILDADIIMPSHSLFNGWMPERKPAGCIKRDALVVDRSPHWIGY